jgi:phosphoribosylamine--glycine ligase
VGLNGGRETSRSELLFDRPERFEQNPHVKVLVVGGGGREHALVGKIRESPLVEEVLCAPGNAGIAAEGRCVAVPATDVTRLASLAESERVDLTVVGPEMALTLGITEEFSRRGLAIFGASREAARLESSKVFAKEFLERHGIPTAPFRVFGDAASARSFLESAETRFPLVVKADGLAAGKGVLICEDRTAGRAAVRLLMEERVHGAAGDRIVVEELLTGREVSFFVLTDGTAAIPLETCQDYKRIGEGDTGPNTGGMGGYSPSAYLDDRARDAIMSGIVEPTIRGLAREGTPYRGVLYVGLMLTPSGPQVLEYNARFGDPEAQVLLPRMRSDIVPILAAVASGRLGDAPPPSWREESAVVVVMTSSGYPGPHARGMAVRGLAAASRLEGVSIFHAGTSAGPGGEIVVSGGRVLAVTALGPDLAAAAARAYEAVGMIQFEGMHCRKDIARDAVMARGPGPRIAF